MKVLDDPKRRSIRQKLSPVIGDEDAENLVSALPSEGDRLVTEDFLRAELAENFSIFRTEMDDKFATKEFLKSEFADFGVTMEEKFATKEFLRAELAERFQKQTVWTCSTFVAGIVALATVMKFF